MVETGVRIQIAVQQPAVMTKAIDTSYNLPVTVLGVIDLCRKRFIHIHTTPSNYHKFTLVENAAMLETRFRSAATLDWRLNPIPTPISMLAKPPYIFQRSIILRSATEDHHHASGWALPAHFSRVIDSRNWSLVPLNCHFTPLEGTMLDIQYPDVVDSLGSVVSAAHDEKRFVEDHRMSIPAARRAP